jgi:hypothetical protein
MDLYLEFLRKVKRGDEMSELHIQIWVEIMGVKDISNKKYIRK